jgi:hypothetical protein
VDDAQDSSDPARDVPLGVLSELLRVVPRFVDRTRSQAELAANLGRQLPCLSGLLLSGSRPAPEDDPIPPDLHERVPVDVLSVLDDDAATASPPVEVVPEPPAEVAAAPEPAALAPAESELPIQDYDSLAASQVVPRLATMSHDELRAVRDYELAHRKRQTILNRVAQRLSE